MHDLFSQAGAQPGGEGATLGTCPFRQLRRRSLASKGVMPPPKSITQHAECVMPSSVFNMPHFERMVHAAL